MSPDSIGVRVSAQGQALSSRPTAKAALGTKSLAGVENNPTAPLVGGGRRRRRLATMAVVAQPLRSAREDRVYGNGNDRVGAEGGPYLSAGLPEAIATYWRVRGRRTLILPRRQVSGGRRS